MNTRRVKRLNSLLRQVISEVIHNEVKNPYLPGLVTVTHVDITKDLRHAKVYVSVIGEEEKCSMAIAVLQSAAGFISISSSKKVVMRFFPELTFILDQSVDSQMKIDELLSKIDIPPESSDE